MNRRAVTEPKRQLDDCVPPSTRSRPYGKALLAFVELMQTGSRVTETNAFDDV
jgi:hypothetical protein